MSAIYSSIVQSRCTIRSFADATEVVCLCNRPDDSWNYVLVDLGNGRARVDVYDEEGVLVHAGF